MAAENRVCCSVAWLRSQSEEGRCVEVVPKTRQQQLSHRLGISATGVEVKQSSFGRPIFLLLCRGVDGGEEKSQSRLET